MGEEPKAAEGASPPVSPPVPPPPEAEKRSWWRVVSGAPGWVKGGAGFIVVVGGAIGVIYSFMPADLELNLSCRPQIVSLEATNGGGQTATLGNARFEMISTARFGNEDRHAMDADALENPIRANPAIPKGESRVYEWLNVYQPEEAAEGETCHLYLSVPLVSDQDREFVAECECGAE